MANAFFGGTIAMLVLLVVLAMVIAIEAFKEDDDDYFE